jgi:hypothetical protein
MQENAICAVHPGEKAIGTCLRCGSFVCLKCTGPSLEKECEKCRALAVAKSATPWERRAELGLFAAFWETWKTSMKSPNLFFRGVKPNGTLSDAFYYGWFAVLIATPGNILNQILSWWVNSKQMDQSFRQLNHGHVPEWFQAMTPINVGLVAGAVQLFAYPLMFFLGTALIHAGCVMVGARQNGFNATGRALGYSQGASLLAAVPLIGGFLALYVLVLEVYGIARLQDTSEGKAVVAILLVPLLFGCCGGILAAVAIGAAVAR